MATMKALVGDFLRRGEMVRPATPEVRDASGRGGGPRGRGTGLYRPAPEGNNSSGLLLPVSTQSHARKGRAGDRP